MTSHPLSRGRDDRPGHPRARGPHAPTSGRLANRSTGQLIWRACARSDHPRFFGDRIDLVLEEFELGLERRDFPGEFGVLDDELLEEGEDGLVGIFGFHV